jgi:hypothetical protein
LGASAVWAKAVALISANVNAAKVVVRIIASPLRKCPLQVGTNVRCFNLRGKNENYKNLRDGEVPFILRSGAATSDARSQIS